ncbi:MAG: site-2 protease family protein [Candidatus Firestonebacteria bacterium]
MISFIAFIGVFSVIVLVHECGHFIAAKRFGVKVYEFSIGFPFGPRVFLFKHKETEFTLRLFPLGGFVSFSKEGDENTGNLFEVSNLNRALIVSAGSFFNIIFSFIVFTMVFFIARHLNFIDAIALTAKTMGIILSGTITTILNIISGKGSMEAFIGPVGIAVMAGQVANKGILDLLYFSGILSMSLGIMNFIPFPALDGGQLFLLLIEAVKKKKLSLKTYQIINSIGFLLFILLTIIVTYKDIIRFIA